MSEDGEINIEEIKQKFRDYGFAVKVQNAAEKIYQRTKKDLYEISKKYGGAEFLKKISEDLDKEENLGITVTDKMPCSDCGKLMHGDDDHFHNGDKFYCLKCAGKIILARGIKVSDE